MPAAVTERVAALSAVAGGRSRGGAPGLVVEIGRRLLVAVRCTAGAEGVRIDAVVRAPIPPEVDARDAEALGAWIGATLREHGIRPGPAVLCVPRDRVVLRRLVMPTTAEHELPGMVELAMQREVIVEAGEPVIDFVPLPRAVAAGGADEADETEPAGGTTPVLAVALAPGERDRILAVAKAAGLAPVALTLRSHGAATLAAGGDGADATVLVVDLAGDAPEFTVVERGFVRFSRAAETPAGEAGAMPAPSVLAAEADRAWMSWRIAGGPGSGGGAREGAGAVDAVLVLGPDDLRDAVERAVAERLGLHVASHDGLSSIEVAGGDALAAAAASSLAGVALRRRRREPCTDLLSPRRAADPQAARRRTMTMAAGLLLVLGLLGWTMARKDLAALETELGELRAQQRKLAEPYAELQRTKARLEHLDRWLEVRPDWAGHLAATAGLLPEPGDAVLDGWIGTLRFGGVAYADGAWSAPAAIEIVLDGEARDRTIADALRGHLVALEPATARSISSDGPGGRRLAFPFTFRLETPRLAPEPAAKAPEEPDAERVVRREDAAAEATE